MDASKSVHLYGIREKPVISSTQNLVGSHTPQQRHGYGNDTDSRFYCGYGYIEADNPRPRPVSYVVRRVTKSDS
jgi:hypothetical protein